jgi:thioesterase domain-containing protein
MLGIGGNYVATAMIANGLGGDRPFYSLEMPGLDNGRAVLERIEDIADRCRDAMECSAGRWESCVLLGACAGSLVVFELARRLAAAGRTVEMVVMVDPAPIGAKRAPRLSSLRLWRGLLMPRFVASRLGMYLRESRALKGRARRAYLKQKLAVARDVVSHRGGSGLGSAEIHETRVRETTSAALQCYTPRRYDGRVALVLGDRYASNAGQGLSAEWRAVCSGGIDVATVPGKDSGAMLSPPNVQVLISRLNKLLEDR